MFESLMFGFTEMQWVVTTVLIIFTWYLKRESASAKEVLDLRLRVVEIENAVKDMPSKLEIARLEGQIESIKGQLNAANNSIAQVQRGVTRIENYLLENKK